MTRYLLSADAEIDLYEIAEYSRLTWGPDRAAEYVKELRDACRELGSTPHVGRTCFDVQPGLWRYVQGSHAIFYVIQKGGDVFVVRILHQRMLPDRHL